MRKRPNLVERTVQCPYCKELHRKQVSLAAVRSGKRHFGFPQLYHSDCLSKQALERQRKLEGS